MSGKQVVRPVVDDIAVTSVIDVTDEQKVTLQEIDHRIKGLVTTIDRKTLEVYTANNYKNRIMKEEISFIRKTMKSTTILTDYLLNMTKEFNEEVYNDIKSLEICSGKYTIMSEIMEYIREKMNNYFTENKFNKYILYREYYNMLNELMKSFNIDKQLIIKKYQRIAKDAMKVVREIENTFDAEINYKSGDIYVNDGTNLLHDSLSEYLNEVSAYIAKEKYSTTKITAYITELSNMLQSAEIPAEYKPRISQLISKLATCLTTINSEKE